MLYGDRGRDSLLTGLSRLYGDWTGGRKPAHELARRANALARRLVALALRLGLEGDLWRGYLAWLLATDENPFTLARERAGAGEDGLSRLARADLEVLRRLGGFDFGPLEADVGVACFAPLRDFRFAPLPEDRCDREAGRIVTALARAVFEAGDADAAFEALSDHYRRHGAGLYGLYRAFRAKDAGDGVQLLPVGTERVTLDDLIGYEGQKAELRRNTRAFVGGRGFNNMLLYGDAGTGKSTSVKGLLNEFAGQGLRLVELYKHQFHLLPELIAMLRRRNYPFMIFIDDLSFEEDEVEYKYLKAVIEGGIEARPANVMICATSNRRHLIRETWNDRRDMEHDGDIHRSDTVEEKLSLAGRFGCAVSFSTPDRRLYHEIVKGIAARDGVDMDEEQMIYLANRWELRHGGVSGRAARQFINAVIGAETEE